MTLLPVRYAKIISIWTFFYCLYRYNKTVKINQLGSQQLSSSPRVSRLFPGACFRGSTQRKTYSKTFITSDFKVVLSGVHTRSTSWSTRIWKKFKTLGPNINHDCIIFYISNILIACQCPYKHVQIFLKY